MSFEVCCGDVVVHGVVLPVQSDHGFSLCSLWIEQSPEFENTFHSSEILSHIFKELVPMGYFSSEIGHDQNEGDEIVVHQDLDDLILLCDDDLTKIGMMLAAEFEIEEDMLEREVRRALSDFEFTPVSSPHRLPVP